MINKQLIVMQAEAGYDLDQRPGSNVIKLYPSVIYELL
jgi:hypothetical protein